MLTKIFLVRHGEVEGNAQKRYVGASNSCLNATGIAQAKALGERFLEDDFDVAYLSPMERVKETFQIALGAKRIGAVHFRDGLKERNFGIFENHTIEEIQEKFPEHYTKYMNQWREFQIPEGESALESYKRCTDAFDAIVKENEGKKILVVTHLGFIRYNICHRIGGGLDSFWNYFAQNASVTEMWVENGFYILRSLSA